MSGLASLSDNALFDAVARIARHEAAGTATASVGVVTGVQTSVLGQPHHAVSVRLRDRGVVLRDVPVAVGALGTAVTPAVDDLVLVVFAEGDHHAPVVVGRLYHSGLAPPEHAEGQLVLALPPGAAAPDIEAKLDPATPEVVLTVGQTTVEITRRTARITIGDAEVVVDGSGPAAVTVTTGQSSVELSGADVTVEATGNLTLKGNRVEVKGQSAVVISGATVDVN